MSSPYFSPNFSPYYFTPIILLLPCVAHEVAVELVGDAVLVGHGEVGPVRPGHVAHPDEVVVHGGDEAAVLDVDGLRLRLGREECRGRQVPEVAGRALKKKGNNLWQTCSKK